MNKYLVVLLFIVLGMVSCKQLNQEPAKQSPTGAPGDVLLVISERIWKSNPGDTLRSILASPVEALPQDEPRFDVVKINHDKFDHITKRHRNIVWVKVGSDQPESKILVQKNLWAKNQILLTLLAPDETALTGLLSENREKIVMLIVNKDLKTLAANFESAKDPEISKILRNNFKIDLAVPNEYVTGTNKPDFLWVSLEYRNIKQGILVYTYPYRDKNTFSRDFLVKKRNSVVKQNVQGEIEGSYMTTESLFPPIYSAFEHNGHYTAEIRGLWRMQDGLIMGGPFVSLSQLDEKRNRIVTVEGFVYGPGEKKRDLMQQVEAIVYSLKIIDDAGSTGGGSAKAQ